MQISPLKDAQTHAQIDKSGDSGGSGDTFRLPLACGTNTSLIQLDGKDYVAFDLEWKDNDVAGNRTITAAGFVDNRGNQKVLQIDHKNLSLFWLL
jgi:hypothetical protein